MKKTVGVIFSLSVFFVAFYSSYLFYAYRKAFPKINFSPGLFVEDSLCLYKNKPSFKSKEIQYVTKDSGTIQEYHVVANVHRLGFRIDTAVDQEVIPGGVLAIGDSITWGWPCKNSETYGAVVAQKLKLPFYNYGTSSYGWYESVLRYSLLGREGLLTLLKPKYLIIGSGYWMFERSASPFYPTWDLPLLHPYWGYNYDRREWSLVPIPEFLNQKYNFRLSKKIHATETPNLSYKLGWLSLMSPRWISATLYRIYLNKCMGLDPMYPMPWLRQSLTTKQMEQFIKQMLCIVDLASKSAKIKPKVILLGLGDSRDINTTLYMQALKTVAEDNSIIFIDGYKEAKKNGLEQRQYYGHCGPAGHNAFAVGILEKIRNN